MQEYLDEFKDVSNELHESNLNNYIKRKDKKRSIMILMLYGLFLILPSIIYTFFFFPVFNDSDVFYKDYSSTENAFRKASLDQNAFLIVYAYDEIDYYDSYDVFLVSIGIYNDYEYFINSYSMYDEMAEDTDEANDAANLEQIKNILNGSYTHWANNKPVVIYTPEENVSPDYLNSPIYNVDNVVVVERLQSDLTAALFNFVVYLSFTTAAVIIYFKPLKYEFLTYYREKNEKLPQIAIGLAYIFVGNILASILATIISFIFNSPLEQSVNQISINQQLFGSYGFLIIITAVLIGPIFEELVFRKAIFSLIKNPVIALIASSTVFGLIHVSTELFSGNILLTITSGLTYVAGGVALGLVYLKSQKNIFIVTTVHMIYNLIGIILQMI